MIEAIFGSFALVALSEMGDKTQLLAFSLAARFKKPWPIMGGILAATLLNHALAAYAGEWVSRVLSAQVLAWIVGASFVAFGFWTLKPDEHDDDGKPSAWGPFWTTTVAFFFAEMGDKTQLATVALGARYQAAVFVAFGTTLGMLASDGLAVFLGEKLARRVDMKWIRRAAAAAFFAFGILSIWHGFSLQNNGVNAS